MESGPVSVVVVLSVLSVVLPGIAVAVAGVSLEIDLGQHCADHVGGHVFERLERGARCVLLGVLPPNYEKRGIGVERQDLGACRAEAARPRSRSRTAGEIRAAGRAAVPR